MVDSSDMMTALDSRVRRRNERRDFFKTFGVAAAVGGGMMLASQAAQAQAAPSDADVLNFALNLEYLEANFYSYAVNGTALPANMTDGSGKLGVVRPGRAVKFKDPVVAAYAKEIAADEIAHVNFLRTQLGVAKVAQPEIDVSPEGAFTAAAMAAGLITAGQTFDPYATDENFLLGAFIFEDVGVTAYKGGSILLTNKTYLEAAAGILAVEAYHAAIVRTTLFAKGMETPSLKLIEATEAISAARDSLDGPSDDDQGVAMIGDVSNIAPLDPNAIAFSRDANTVHNIVYLTSKVASKGGFFPNGTNGAITTSAAH